MNRKVFEGSVSKNLKKTSIKAKWTVPDQRMQAGSSAMLRYLEYLFSTVKDWALILIR